MAAAAILPPMPGEDEEAMLEQIVRKNQARKRDRARAEVNRNIMSSAVAAEQNFERDPESQAGDEDRRRFEKDGAVAADGPSGEDMNGLSTPGHKTKERKQNSGSKKESLKDLAMRGRTREEARNSGRREANDGGGPCNCSGHYGNNSST